MIAVYHYQNIKYISSISISKCHIYRKIYTYANYRIKCCWLGYNKTARRVGTKPQVYCSWSHSIKSITPRDRAANTAILHGSPICGWGTIRLLVWMQISWKILNSNKLQSREIRTGGDYKNNIYHKTFNESRTLVHNNIVDHSDELGTYSLST